MFNLPTEIGFDTASRVNFGSLAYGKVFWSGWSICIKLSDNTAIVLSAPCKESFESYPHKFQQECEIVPFTNCSLLFGCR